MFTTLTIAKRELASVFFSPIAYVVLGLFSLLTTFIFFLSFAKGMPATLRSTFEWVVWLMIFLPFISMRLISEELRSGTIEPLMTAPISDTQVVMGKWLGAMGFLGTLLLLPFVVLVAVLEFNAAPDYGPIGTGILGLLMVGGLYLAVGTFASAITQNQIIAAIVSIAIILFSLLISFATQFHFLASWVKQVIYYVNVDAQFSDFTKGVIDTSKVIFFISWTAFFLFLAVKVLESRRWR